MSASDIAPATRSKTAIALFLAALLGFGLLPGGPTTASEHTDDQTSWEGLMLPPGVEGEVIVEGLNFPTGIDWDDEDNLYVSLVGFIPENRQILRIDENGSQTPVGLEEEELSPQILDITFHEGRLYFTTTGKIHVHDLETNQTETIVEGLPSWGDHRTDEIVFGPDGRLYVGQGTVTNSGVVGLDQLGVPNAINNVSGSRPTYRDLPCEEVSLSGYNWETMHPFVVNSTLNADEGAGIDSRLVQFTTEEEVRNYTEDARDTAPPPIVAPGEDQGGDTRAEGEPGAQDQGPADEQPSRQQELWLTWQDTSLERVITGPYSPFATATYQNQTLEADPRCNGSVISMEPDGSDLRPVAWGFRNPFALKFDDDGRLWVSDNGPDKRGSRPLGPGPDTIQGFDVPDEGETLPWFGWPDYTMGIPYTDPFFAPPWGPEVQPVFEEPPSRPITQDTFSGAHASSNKFDFGPNGTAYQNSIFSAEFGSLGSAYHIGALAGMAVVRVDMDDGRVTEFITSADRWDGTFRPVEAAIGPDDRLYVVDFGAATQEPGTGNATHGLPYNQTFEPERGRVLAFSLPDDMEWEGRPLGNPGGDGQNMTQGEVSQDAPSNASVVDVFDYGFSASATYQTGQPIAFENNGNEGHTATEYNGTFNSGFELAPGTTYTWTPEEPGTYQFYCAVHPGMTGTITVQEEIEEQEPEDDEEQDEVPALGIIGLIVSIGALLWWARPRDKKQDED